MKKRFYSFLKFLGVVMLLLIIMAIIAIVIGLNYMNKQSQIPNHAILELKFYNNISERSAPESIVNKYLNNQDPTVSMREILYLLDEAKTDDKIEAILVDGGSLLSHTKALELQDVLEDFKQSCDKPIYAYGNYFRQGAFLAASVADSIFIHPMGNIDIKGYAIIFSYFKDFLDRYDLDMEVFRAGRYKSYVESYLRNDASEENRAQYSEYLNSLKTELIENLASNRELNIDIVSDILDKNGASNATNCLSLDLVDGIEYQTDFRTRLKKQFDLEDDGFIGLKRYKDHRSCYSKKGKTKVAYIAMSGDIGQQEGEITSNHLKKVFSTIRDDDEIKSILIRMDSGGGSAFASEDIWHEIALCKAKGKEVITSISSIAGSGGYYVIAHSDKIFANKNSVVGSIGVFTAFPVFKNALKKHVGVHFDEIKTGPFAARIENINNLTKQQREYYQRSTNELYSTFKTRVEEGRNLEKIIVDSIAQGRIYTGEVALELGLVDSLISLEETISYIKNKYNGQDIEIIEYQSNSKGYFEDFDISDIIKATSLNNDVLTELTIESIKDFSTIFNSSEPLAKTDFFHISQ